MEEKDKMTVAELSAYLVGHPKPGTIRLWTSKKKIPFYKVSEAKNADLYFIKQEIDLWSSVGRSMEKYNNKINENLH